MKSLKGMCAALVVALVGMLAVPSASAQNYQRHWNNLAQQRGEGMPCEHQGKTLACVWFEYDEAGRNRFLGCDGDLQRDSQQRDVLQCDLYRTTGIQPMNYDPSRLQVSTVGKATLVFDSESSATFTFSFTNESGSIQTGTRKLSPFQIDRTGKRHYQNKVYALWDGGMPFVVTKSGATRVINKTHIPGVAPVVSCSLAYPQLDDGIVLTSCLDARNAHDESTRATYYIDPTTDELHDYSGPISPSLVFRTLSLDPSTPQWMVKTDVADGTYFNSGSDIWSLYFKSSATGTTALVRSSPNNNVSLLMTYSN